MTRTRSFAATAVWTLAILCGSAGASRPLGVDHANIDAKGTGHVEAWVAREARKADVLHVAPAFSPWEVVELSALLSRNRTSSTSSAAALARFRITEPQTSGCNLLLALGHEHFSPGGNQPFTHTAATCNRRDFALHATLGAAKPSGRSSFGTWGIALEHDTGTFIAHVESFGQEHSKPTFQLGARRTVAKGWQVDGTLGRLDGLTIFSLGAKFLF
ncbi:MAG: hypothetical protein WA210_22595 [Burkholderiaceae bacterium]